MNTKTPHPAEIEYCVAETLVAEWMAERPEGLLSRTKLIDRLLDLRSLLDPLDRLVVEAVIVDMPGVTVVEAGWWVSQLGQLQLLVSGEPVG